MEVFGSSASDFGKPLASEACGVQFKFELLDMVFAHSVCLEILAG